MNRREALSLLAALPFAARVEAQTRPTAKHRIVLGAGHGLLLEPGGTLKSWSTNRGAGEQPPAENALGLGHSRPIEHFTLYPVAGLANVIAAAAGSGTSYAVLADGRLLAWGTNGFGLLGTTPLSTLEVTAQFGPHSNTPLPVAVKFDAVDVLPNRTTSLRSRATAASTRGEGAKTVNSALGPCRSSISRPAHRPR